MTGTTVTFLDSAPHEYARFDAISTAARSTVVAPPRQWRPRTYDAKTGSDATAPASGDMPEHTDPLLARLSQLPPGDASRTAARTQAIEWYLPMATHFARRYNGRGQPLADLVQVATIGLIKAVDRYDPGRGVAFSSYAIPTILGEIKRHFRDTAWNIRIPRRLQELTMQLTGATEDLAHTLHRAPTTAELAAHLGVSQREVLAAQRSAYAYQPVSLERLQTDSQDSRLLDLLGAPDPGHEAAEQRVTLRVVLSRLPKREQRIIMMRFVAGLTQTQIAMDIGVSQMQVSRLLNRTLAQLRAEMLTMRR
jgi:RNA polymerase sigma-B factor